MHVSAEITKWYQDKDVAFAIGVDELNTGGSFKDGPEDEEWDAFYWYRAKNDFWTLYWKPILDENPWVRYSIGWTPSHNSPHNLQNYPEPKGINKQELTWNSREGKRWMNETLKPIFKYCGRHYDEWAGHGYWHEEGINRYYPYWNPGSPLFNKEEWYRNPNFLLETFVNLQAAFKQTWGHKCIVWNTCPFTACRPDMPSLFQKYGICGLGLLSDLTGQPVDINTGLIKTSNLVKSYMRPLGSIITHEGSMPGHDFKAKVGEMSYWHQDATIADKRIKAPFKLNSDDHIVIAPYSLSLEGTPFNFKSRVRKMMNRFYNFDAPFLYYFMHAQMNWIDALGGGSLVHRIREYKSAIAIVAALTLLLTSFISMHLALGILLFFIAGAALFLIAKWIGGEFYRKLVFIWGYGKNAKKHNRELKWLYKAFGERLWITTFSEACEYFDLRKKSKIDIKQQKDKIIITIDSRDSLSWDGRAMPVSLKLKGIASVKNCSLLKGTKKIRINSFRALSNGDIIIDDVILKPNAITRYEFGF
ncbi:MAG: hypothetical protein WC852_00030 [Candidatus Nanoarchaeia archaeon]|jgi:hypothetical protein